MSQENVELVERVIAAVNERDMDAYLAVCTDDIRLQTPWTAIEGVYEGRDAIRRFFADLRDTMPDFHLTIESWDSVAPDRLLVFVRAHVSGRASGISAAGDSLSTEPPEGGIPTANVYDFSEGKISRIRVYVDRAAALEAAGLPG